MHCVSAYPTPEKELNLANIKWLQDQNMLGIVKILRQFMRINLYLNMIGYIRIEINKNI